MSYAVTIRIHTVADALRICYATGSRTLLIGEKDKEKKKEQEKHHDLGMCISAFQYYYLRIYIYISDIEYEMRYIFFTM